MRARIPTLIEALENETWVTRKSIGVNTIRLTSPEVRSRSSTSGGGVTTVWFQTPDRDFAPSNDEPVAQVQIGISTLEATILAAEPGRILLSIEHQHGPLPSLSGAVLIRDATALLEQLRSRLAEAHAGLRAMNWDLLEKVEGLRPPRVETLRLSDCAVDGLTPEQQRAVATALGSEVLFLQGPPGTGKTKTISHIVATALAQRRSVLVASHTHVAVDQALWALIESDGALPTAGLDSSGIIRVGEPRLPQIPQEFVYTRAVAEDSSAQTRSYREAEAAFATLSKIYMDEEMLSRQWDFVLIDEVSMVNLALAVMALGLAKRGIIMVGDPHQLPPIVQSNKVQTKKTLGTDLFELFDAPSRSCFSKLTLQHRMRPRIANIARDLRYGASSLQDAEETELRPGPAPDSTLGSGELAFVPVSPSGNSVYRESDSYWNLANALATVDVAAAMAAEVPSPGPEERKPIGIVTPYAAQRRLLVRLAAALGIIDRVLVGTVHTFQGNEADRVLFDTVLGPPITKSARLLQVRQDGETERQVNVAVTRARDQLAVVGDPVWWRDHEEAPLGRVVREIRRSTRSPRWSPMADETDIWKVHHSLNRLLSDRAKADSFVFMSGIPDDELGHLAIHEESATVALALDPRTSDTSFPEGILVIPWAESPEILVTDVSVGVCPNRSEWVEVVDTDVADELGRLLRLKSVIEHFALDRLCPNCRKEKIVEFVWTRSQYPVRVVCRHCGWAKGMERHRGSLNPERDSEIDQVQPGYENWRLARQRRREALKQDPPTVKEITRPSSGRSLESMIPDYPEEVRAGMYRICRVESEYQVRRDGQMPVKYGTRILERAWRTWDSTGRRPEARLEGISAIDNPDIQALFNAIAGTTTSLDEPDEPLKEANRLSTGSRRPNRRQYRPPACNPADARTAGPRYMDLEEAWRTQADKFNRGTRTWVLECGDHYHLVASAHETSERLQVWNPSNLVGRRLLARASDRDLS